MAQQFAPAGTVTLTTDFGHEGPFVATMKGRIYTRLPTARIIDITHEIPVHWPAEAGFWLERSYGYFPPGTVHVAVVDPGVGTRRDIAIVRIGDHVFLAPDNGLLAPLVQAARRQAVAPISVHRLVTSTLTRLGLGQPSATFHGRDIFAPLAAELAAGRCQPGDLGEPLAELVPSWLEEAQVHGRQIAGLVVAIDHFGNLITNIDRSLVQPLRSPLVRTGNHEFPLKRTYGDARPGDYLALINSFNVVEIARAERHAADGLGVGRGAPVTVVDAVSGG